MPPADWTQWFRHDYAGAPFVTFGRAHLWSLVILAAFGALMLRYRGADEATRRRVRYALAVLLVVNESAWHIWQYHYGAWSLTTMLPLHLCSALVWVGAYGLLTLNPLVYEFMYFMGIAGPLQAVLTPDAAQYGLPHFRAVQTLVSHGTLIVAALYLTRVEGLRPTVGSMRRVILGTMAYMVFVTIVNLALGSNYMWTLGKPPVVSLLDVLGPWPWYLIPVVLLGILNVLLLYAPFWWADRRRARAAVTRDPPAA